MVSRGKHRSIANVPEVAGRKSIAKLPEVPGGQSIANASEVPRRQSMAKVPEVAFVVNGIQETQVNSKTGVWLRRFLGKRKTALYSKLAIEQCI